MMERKIYKVRVHLSRTVEFYEPESMDLLSLGSRGSWWQSGATQKCWDSRVKRIWQAYWTKKAFLKRS